MPHPTTAVVVRHPEARIMVALDPGFDYEPDDILVTTYPQFFTPVGESGRIIESVRIEAATAAPGEKRSRTRTK